MEHKIMEKSTWRLLIPKQPASGAWNMALDEAILNSIAQGSSPPTLRLYAWSPPCLSLGYAQPYADIDLDRVNTRGWDIVRRPTGGRAIVHTDELTYSVIAPQSEPRVKGGVLESYQRLSTALLEALKLLGLPAQADKEYDLPAGANPKGAVCFEIPSKYEITVDHKKLIGSAQARRKQVVLQHGSLPLSGDLTRIVQVLRYDSETEREIAAQRLLERATTVQTVSGKSLSWNSAANAVIRGFETTLNLTFERAQLSDHELEDTRALINEKHANPEWIERL
jgi:lipoate-protein ligase A